jgi:hypothetical protein
MLDVYLNSLPRMSLLDTMTFLLVLLQGGHRTAATQLWHIELPKAGIAEANTAIAPPWAPPLLLN